MRRKNRAKDTDDFCLKLYYDENQRNSMKAGGDVGNTTAYLGACEKQPVNKLMMQEGEREERDHGTTILEEFRGDGFR